MKVAKILFCFLVVLLLALISRWTNNLILKVDLSHVSFYIKSAYQTMYIIDGAVLLMIVKYIAKIIKE